MDIKVITSIIASVLITGSATVGITTLYDNPAEPIPLEIGESRLLFQDDPENPMEEIVVVKKANDKELILGNITGYDKDTGEAIQRVETVMVSELQLNTNAIQNDNIRYQNKIDEYQTLLESGSGDTRIKPQFDSSTGEATQGIELEVVLINQEIQARQNAITANQTTITNMQALITLSDRVQ